MDSTRLAWIRTTPEPRVPRVMVYAPNPMPKATPSPRMAERAVLKPVPMSPPFTPGSLRDPNRRLLEA